ncbi:thyroid receptor-interacting protein 11-like [Sapajus apella]|uniref:Thyroid receptor-interacting protein 11-like n=1 Tax=Sapajus apella TaxID=9515 RepID=A0A6J3HF66_SAPAP|nr:thyroid receptor-interacting protein 11-like [Sapajus apella]
MARVGNNVTSFIRHISNVLIRGTVSGEEEFPNCDIKDIEACMDFTEPLNETLQHSQPAPVAAPRTADPIMGLETEVSQLKGHNNSLEADMKSQKITQEQLGSKMQLLQSLQHQKQEMDDLKCQQEQMNITHTQRFSAKDEEINLQNTKQQIQTHLCGKREDIQTDRDVFQTREVECLRTENGTEKPDSSKLETERLVKGMNEQELEMKVLHDQSMTLTERMDQPSISEVGRLTHIIQQEDVEVPGLQPTTAPASHTQGVAHLQQQLPAPALETQEISGVWKEAARKNSYLEGEYHHPMDGTADNEGGLCKLQEENKNSTTSSGQERFTDNVLKSTHLNQEKDIEIDALSQKCQPLATILQTSSTGHDLENIAIYQYEELPPEPHILKQPVKKVEAWKEQLVTTVQNVQQGAPQPQEELPQLQAKLLIGSDDDSQCQMNCRDLMQNYEGRKTQLKNLGQELAHTQRSSAELCRGKESLFPQPDILPQLPREALSSHSAESLHASESVLSTESSKLLRQEIEKLRKALQEKDAAIRSLQEDNQRLSDSTAAASERERKEHEQMRSEIQQLKEKQNVLDRLLRGTNLFIRAKNSLIRSLRENLTKKMNKNELLRQAVRTLKKRVSVLETDMDELKQDNEKIAETSREKEIEYQEEIKELEKQNVVLQERLDYFQQKCIHLASSTEGKVDKLLMRNLFIRYLQTPKHREHVVLQAMGSILGVTREKIEQWCQEERGAVTRWTTGCLGGGSRSIPRTPLGLNQQPALNGSFSERFVKFLQTESLSSTPPTRLAPHNSPGQIELV